MIITKKLAHRLISLAVLCLLIAVCLIVLAVFYGWSNFAGGMPELKPWHEQALEAEFDASDERDGYDFDDYLAQEKRVFKELDALIDGPWKAAASGEFCRFRRDSVSYPTALLDKNWNRSFINEVADAKGGILMIHGLSDSPYSLRGFSERMQAAGYTVMVLRVPGHGTCPAALAEIDWQDWTAAVRVAARDLRRRLPEGRPMMLMGFSNGGALSVDYAVSAVNDDTLPQADGLILMSPMIGINPMARITRYHNVIAAVSGEERAHWSGVGAAIDPYKYSSWPMNASVQAWKMTSRVEKGLAELQKGGRMGEFPPVLTCQSAIDATVKVKQLIGSLYSRVEENGSELLVFDINRAGWLESLVKLNFEEALMPAFENEHLSYRLTLVTNVSDDSREVVAKTRSGADVNEIRPGLSWPEDVFSLAHSALPFPADDPIYGERTPGMKATRLPLGALDFKGESGVLMISDGQILRLRHNPFFPCMAAHVLEWVEGNIRPE